MDLDQAGKQRLVGMLSSAKKTHSAAALERLEEAFAIAVGAKPPVTPDDPLQAGTGFFFPGLAAKPWHDNEAFPLCAKLEGAWQTIRDELKTALDRKSGFQRYALKRTGKDSDLHAGAPPEWKALYLKEHSVEFSQNRAMCPETVKIIDGDSRVANYAYFSALDPSGHVGPFYASYNWTFNIQMGLIVPDNCGVRVREEIRRWEEGKCLTFDASFEHEAWNRGDFTLFTLVITTFHPDLTDLEVSFLKQVNFDLASSVDLAHAAELKEGEKQLEGQKWWV